MMFTMEPATVAECRVCVHAYKCLDEIKIRINKNEILAPMYVYVPLLMLPTMAFHSYDCQICYSSTRFAVDVTRPRLINVPHRIKIALVFPHYSVVVSFGGI